MNRQEPYIGMPINLADFDDLPASTGTVEIQPLPVESANMQSQQNQQSMQAQQSQQSMQTQQAAQMQPMVVGMAYVPWQRWQQPYGLEEGFEAGTIFPDLNLPFEGYRIGGTRR